MRKLDALCSVLRTYAITNRIRVVVACVIAEREAVADFQLEGVAVACASPASADRVIEQVVVTESGAAVRGFHPDEGRSSGPAMVS